MVIDTVTQPPWDEGILPSNRLMGCAAGWGRILTAGLTIKGLHFSLELLEWDPKFSDLGDSGR